MAFFNKSYTEDELEILKLEISTTMMTVDADIINMYNQLQTLAAAAEKIKILQKATKQDVIQISNAYNSDDVKYCVKVDNDGILTKLG